MADRKIDDVLLNPLGIIKELADTERQLAAARRRIEDLLEANSNYLDRARKAERELAHLPAYKPLTPAQLASALDAFWNPALADAQARGGGQAADFASVMATGFAAVARALNRGD